MAENDEQQKWRVALHMFERSQTALADANDLCRSAMAIAKRRGRNTNWEAFERKLEASLRRQHEVMYVKTGGAGEMNASDYSKLAHEIISEYNDANNPGLLRQKIAEAFADVVTKAIADERDVGTLAHRVFRQAFTRRSGYHSPPSATMIPLTLK